MTDPAAPCSKIFDVVFYDTLRYVAVSYVTLRYRSYMAIYRISVIAMLFLHVM